VSIVSKPEGATAIYVCSKCGVQLNAARPAPRLAEEFSDATTGWALLFWTWFILSTAFGGLLLLSSGMNNAVLGAGLAGLMVYALTLVGIASVLIGYTRKAWRHARSETALRAHRDHCSTDF
jgi:hypothetical protein